MAHQGVPSTKRVYLSADGKLRLKESECISTPTVKMKEDEVQIGCTTVDRHAVEYLYREFHKLYPVRADEVTIQ